MKNTQRYALFNLVSSPSIERHGMSLQCLSRFLLCPSEIFSLHEISSNAPQTCS